VITLPPAMDEATSGRAVALAAAVSAAFPGRLRDVVVGYHTVTVYFDPWVIDGVRLEEDLSALARRTSGDEFRTGAHLEVPVCYGGEFGPDLEEVAHATALSVDDVIRLHTSREYRVFVIGFVPGFAYMGPLAPELAVVGRRASPRTRVPSGSVAIAGGQTGIYPMETPGGWRILGRTPIRPFDESRTPPVLFAAGDRVRFRRIDLAEFQQLTH
jgi:inhibitor of KinA